MDVEHRAGQLYNSELPSAYIGLSISNNSNMNQFVNQKPKFRKQLKSQLISSSNNKNKDKSHNLTPTFEVLPKIENNKLSSLNDEMSKESVGQLQCSTNNSTIISEMSKTELPISEAFTKNNVNEWLQMPSKSDSISSDYNDPGSSTISSVSGTMLTPVDVDYFTDCTSVTSSEWGDDVCEFDKKESHKVNQMFEEIEWMLFNDKFLSTRSISNRASNSTSFSDRNGVISGPVHLRRECSEWTHQFPHFRLVGHQISLPQEQGYTFNESERSGSITPKNSPRVLITDCVQSCEITQSKWISVSSDVERLSLVGHSIQPKCNEMDSSHGFDELFLGSSQEEVFALDGDIVEIIAIDYKMDEDYNMHTKKCSSKNDICRNGKAYPPITPNAVIRDAVLTAVFDNLWSHIVDFIVPLSTKVYQSGSLRDISTMDQQQPMSLQNSITPDYYRISKQFNQFPTSLNNLDNILKISSKTLQFREKSYLQSIPEQSQNLTVSMKNSLNFNFNAPKQSLLFINQIRRPSKYGISQDRSQTPLFLNESSFIHDKEMKRTPPLNQSYFMNSSGSENHSPLRCLRGKALYQSHSPDLLARSGTLPPIHKYPTLTHFRPTGSRIGSAQVHNSINQSSSFINNSLATNVLMTTDIANMRPCTSHTARSDQIGGNRSSTPSGTRGSLNLNVHGNSITINNMSMKSNEEVPFEQPNKITRNRPYWKTYNNQMQTSNKRNKSVYNSVK